MKSKLALIGFPFDNNSSYMKGAASAPQLIRRAFYSEASNSWSEQGIAVNQESALFDAGDTSPVSIDFPFDQIESAVGKLLDQNLRPISLGGDHSITYPIIKAFSKKYDNLNILQFDAHPDLYDKYQGNRFSHACPFARIMEAGLAQRLVQVGIRTMNDLQQQQAEKFGVEVIQMKQWKDDTKLNFNSPLYISFDMDVLDPAFAPGISHHEPGGFSTRQAIQVIQGINAPVIVGADIVEFNPLRDLNGMTAMACAKILKELAGKMLLIS
jgi:arginase